MGSTGAATDLERLLLSAVPTVAGLGIVLLALGLIAGPGTGLGARLSRVGRQCLGLLIALYGLLALVVVQSLLNLVFGPAVGNRVTADLIGMLFRGLGFLIVKPLTALRDLFRGV